MKNVVSAGRSKEVIIDEAADSILKEIAAHAQTLPPNERKVRIDAFGKALAKGVTVSQPVNYEAVLADLERRRATLDLMIEMVKQFCIIKE